jgi:hypothetical protein
MKAAGTAMPNACGLKFCSESGIWLSMFWLSHNV